MSDVQQLVSSGTSQPLGATLTADGVNFSVYSERARTVELLLFADPMATEPATVITLDPELHHDFHFWHCRVSGLAAGQVYAYRMSGPADTATSGARFDATKVLLDPYSRGNINDLWVRGDAVGSTDNVATSMRSVVIDIDDYDWEGDQPLRIPLADSVIYEMHVRGFTRSATSGCAEPGTFSGLVEKIPYLQALGVTAVELLPVFDFDETQVVRQGPEGTDLHNYWGYDPIGHFAPQSSYCVQPHRGNHLREFRDMVKALHRAGIEVILDVVYNHTNEGNERGPTISLRGQANETYYHLADDKRFYRDYTGTGNTLNANHPVVTKYIVESLESWVTDHHVDGFRFDLGSVLSRGTDGVPMAVPPVLWNIELSRVLSSTKVIAEAWDAAGLYQVGHFPGERWCEWNGPYRDDIRRFLRGDPGIISRVATRIGGSADLFGPTGEKPTNSINFLTCHDGFTLNDLVSYDTKHNEVNGEGNRDGSDDNASWNCGLEGPTDDPGIDALRLRQTKNALAMLMISRGTPMMLGGDEFRRTQRGNNNAYCQDGELSWYDWSLVDVNLDLVRFVSHLVALRKRFPTLRRNAFFGDGVNARGVPEVSWHGTQLGDPAWNDAGSRVLSFTLGALADEPDLHVILNMWDLDLEFELPAIAGRHWARAVDTTLHSPADIAYRGAETPIGQASYRAGGRSVVILISAAGSSRPVSSARRPDPPTPSTTAPSR